MKEKKNRIHLLEYEEEAVLIRELIKIAQEGKRVRMLGLGHSMSPLLKNGRDFIELEAVTEEMELKRGDVVLYFSNGTYILHRIYKITKQGYCMLGDGNFLVEPPLERKYIYLRATAYIRNGKYILADKWYLKIYGMVWMRMRLLRPVFRRAGRIPGKIRSLLQMPKERKDML